ncbi:toxin VasX [Rodentibacter pneumotropicus]|uniref:toxin VasX n=1 Tax=Rodentibacter pneumotropicus TaxID=758 RepID=UPI00037206F2|nr:toxin VasX [Rodentibacter pneumotropicus]
MKNSKQTKQTKPKMKLDAAKINQAAQELSDGHSKCELPIIPLYPVRYGLSIDYLAKAGAGNIKALTETAPAGIGQSSEHSLMQLRQGFVYIYAHTKHRLFSTDDKGKWLVFRYVTNNDDTNSASEFEQLSTGQNAGLNACFLLCKWGEQGANGDWALGQIDTKNYPCISHIKSFNTVFVDKDVDIVDIAYSEYMWSSEIIERFEKDDKLRQIVMTTVNINTPEKHSAPLKDLNIHVLEYQPPKNSNDLSEQTQSWYTKLNYAAIPTSVAGLPDYQETGLMVALQDVVGEMHELQKVIIDLTEKQKAYYARYAYPITIGNIIDPKIAYDVRGKTYPLKTKQRVIEQKGVQSALINEFNSKMTALLKEPFERYEKPAGKLVKQVVQLAQRASFKEFFNISSDIVSYTPTENSIDRGVYVFYRLLADLTYGLECTADGVEVLENLFSDKPAPANNAPTTMGWLKEHSKKVTDAVYGLAMKILPPQQRHNILQGYFRGMEHVYLNSGRTVANLAALRKIQFDKVMAIYGWDEKRLIKNADYFFAEVADKQIDRLIKEERSRQYNHRRGNGGKKAIKKELRQIKQDLINYRRITLDEIRDLEARIQLTERYYGFSGVLAIYAGILSLNNDLTIPRKLARTAAGRLALDPVIVKTTAILDISVGTADMAYALKLIGKPGAGMGVLRNIAGASTRSILVGLRALAYTGAAVVGGVLTMVIAWGGLQEAIVNEDKVSIVANGAIILSGAMILVGMIPVFSSFGPVGWIILLVATASIFLWGSTPLETWVKKGFWGKKDYFYWGEKRDDVNNQIQRAAILANEEIADITKQHIARLELLATGQVDAVAGGGLPMNKQVEDYILISQGFEKELYEYDIQSGLKISKISQGYYRISCAEFRRTEPTTHNLVINLYQWGSAQALPIKRFYAGASGEVTFYLAENNIHIDEIRIIATFTDKEGGTFEDVYLSEVFENKTKELQQQAQSVMEKAIEEGNSE